jgi:hypothetical protein
VRGIKVFLNLDAGLTRAELPDRERGLRQAHSNLQAKDLQIGQLQRQLARDKEELASLRQRLAREARN